MPLCVWRGGGEMRGGKGGVTFKIQPSTFGSCQCEMHAMIVPMCVCNMMHTLQNTAGVCSLDPLAAKYSQQQ